MAKIMLIDQRALWSATLKLSMQPEHTIFWVHNYNEALFIFQSDGDPRPELSFDLIVGSVDQDCNDKTSIFEFLKTIARRSCCCRIPILMLSIEPSEKARLFLDIVRRAGQALGANDLLVMEHFEPRLFRLEVDRRLETMQKL